MTHSEQGEFDQRMQVPFGFIRIDVYTGDVYGEPDDDSDIWWAACKDFNIRADAGTPREAFDACFELCRQHQLWLERQG